MPEDNLNHPENNISQTSESKRFFDFDQNPMLWRVILTGFLAGLLGAYVGLAVFTKTGTTGGLNTKAVVLDEQSAIVDVANKTRPAVVSILATQKVTRSSVPDDFFGFLFPFGGNEGPSTQTEVSAGTGFFVTSDGIIATNRHVVADESATYRVYTNDGKQYDATVLARDPVNDIALIKINGSNFPTLSLGDSDKIKVGQSVVAIGNALGQFSNTVTTGVVSGINRSIVATGESGNAASNIDGAIQTDAAINPGNSGGPLLDILGSVIGINTAVSAQGQSLGFAIPVNELKKDLRSYSQNKKIVQPFLGIRYVTITEGLQEELNLPVKEGAYITAGQNDNEPAIVPGGPADKAGLKQGDIIIKVNDKDINLENSVASVVRNFNPGDNVQITIIRDGKEQTLTVTLGDRT